jgi:hypothetical protein
MEGKASTSLDTLYSLLLERKIMSVEDIASYFKVSKELVIEWGKILEAGNLAIISNPRIGKAVIKLTGYTGEEPKKRLEKENPKEKLIEKNSKIQEEIIQKNKLTKNRNQGKIKEAKKIISESRKKEYDDEFIKKAFIEKKWPEKLIDELLK